LISAVRVSRALPGFLVQREAFGKYYATTGYDDDPPRTLHPSHRSVSIKLAVAWAFISIFFYFAAYTAASYSAVCVASVAASVACYLIIALYKGER
jgi:hypothetical protein